MGSLNKVLLIGNLGQDPDVRFMPSGDAVVNISVATTDRWKDKTTGEARESVEWHSVSFFGRTAEIIGEYMRKGDPIFVEGSLKTRTYEKDGIKHWKTEIKGKQMQFLKSKGEGGGGATRPRDTAPEDEDQSQPQTAPVSSPKQDDFDDDIPF